VAWLKKINPQVQGWINYYGAFYRSELRFLAWRINEHLARWAMHKFKRFRGKYAKAMAWLQKVYQYKPGLFAHWQLVAFTAGRGLWGPDDRRPSRPVLRAAGGETPPADSPACSPLVQVRHYGT
jgi:Group II intron, maturase-specific domain